MGSEGTTPNMSRHDRILERLGQVDPARRHIAELILEWVPTDGTAIGNVTLRTKTRTKSSDDYKLARDALVGVGLVRLGRGRGGSVMLEETFIAQDDVADRSARTGGVELALYRDVAAHLQQMYDDDTLRWDTGTIVHITALQGRRRTRGKWSRPDITVVAHRRLKVLTGTHVEVHTYEVKTSAALAVDALHEARAHRRCAHNSSVVVDVEDPAHTGVSSLTDAARDLGVGLFSFTTPDEEWCQWLEPAFHQPNPVELDDFLQTQLPKHVTTIQSWRAVPGLAGD